MRLRGPTLHMWREALDMLAHADQLQRQCFQLGAHRLACPLWEPPVDVFETEQQFIVLAALPGVCAEHLRITLEGTVVSVRGRRPMPDLGPGADIHRVEIPFGRFERRIKLPSQQLRLSSQALRDGCLMLTLDKPLPP